jgi:hypothetical protein
MRRLKRASSSWVVPFAALVIIGVGANAGMASGLHSTGASSRSSTNATRLACQANALSVAMGSQVVPFTGEHAIVIVIANNGHKTCLLIGYPAVAIFAGKRRLPFSYDDGGGAYLSTVAPRLLTLQPGDHAAFVVAKYRCDVGELVVGTSIEIWLPGVPGSKRLALSGNGVGMFAVCRKFKANGPPDPGNTVAVSPLEFGRYAQ